MNTGFNRQAISSCILPLVEMSFVGKKDVYCRGAASESPASGHRKVFRIHHIQSAPYVLHRIEWQDIFKQAINMQFINSFEAPSNQWITEKSPYAHGYAVLTEPNQYGIGVSFCNAAWMSYSNIFQFPHVYPIFFFNIERKYRHENSGRIISEEEYWSYEWWEQGGYSSYYMDGDSFTIDLEQCTYNTQHLTYTYDYEGSRKPFELCYTDYKIGVCSNHYDYNRLTYVSYFFVELLDISPQLIGKGNQWAYARSFPNANLNENSYTAPSVYLTSCSEDKIDSRYSYAAFREQTASTIFALRFPAELRNTLYTLNYPNNGSYFIDRNGYKRSLKNYHVALFHYNATEKSIF